MADAVRDFAKTYVVIASVLLIFSAGVTLVAHLSFLYVTMLLFLWGGLAYVLAAALAWTGFANLYRYSPTLFVGSRSYRSQVARGELFKEGRDDESLFIGLAFGAALMAVGAALWDPLFVLVDILGLAAAALAVHARRARIAARS
jgi:hypothetical protein